MRQTTLPDARRVVPIQVKLVLDYSYVPSRRTLAEIMLDVVAHGEIEPRHGTDCICMDSFSYEIKHQLLRALPPRSRPWGQDLSTAEWDRDMSARSRIRHVLRMASNIL